MDLSSPLVLLGIFCVLAAIVGGGLKALGNEVPLIPSTTRQLLLAAAGISLIVVSQVALRRSTFRVTDTSAQWANTVVVSCSEPQPYSGVITVTGSGGTVEYRFILQGKAQPLQALNLPGPGSYGVEGTYSIPFLREFPLLVPVTLQLEVVSPNRLLSPVASLPVTSLPC